MTPEEWRTLVGSRIEERRDELDLSVRAAAKRAYVSEGQWRTIESGQRQAGKGVFFTVNPRRETRRRVCGVLGWSADSIDRLLAGNEPELRDYSDGSLQGRKPGELLGQTPTEPTNADLEAKLDLLIGMVEALGGTKPRRHRGHDTTPSGMPRPSLRP